MFPPRALHHGRRKHGRSTSARIAARAWRHDLIAGAGGSGSVRAGRGGTARPYRGLAALDVLLRRVRGRHSRLVLGRRLHRPPGLDADREPLRGGDHRQHGAGFARLDGGPARSRPLSWPRLRTGDARKRGAAGAARDGRAARVRVLGSPDRKPDRRRLRLAGSARDHNLARARLVLCRRGRLCAAGDSVVRAPAAHLRRQGRATAGA
ncbi:hypothetical protein ACVWZ6_004462 [Bradyrhizobium sp. GM6.1]